jgi:cytochrome bd-type quinol oxidase subunit 2
MDSESQPDEKAMIVGNIKVYVIAACICMAATALFTCLGANAFVKNMFGDDTDWVPFITLCLASILTIVSAAAAWYLVARDRKPLTKLRAIVVERDTLEQPGVWPPPPSVPKD